MKSLTGVAAAAMLAAFAAGNAAGRTYLVSGELCYADGARLYASDGSLSFQPASPAGMYLFENAALPSYTAHPPAGRAVERWALVSLTDAAMHGSYEAASPLLEAFPGDGRVSDDGLVYSPKWKQFSADAGSFIHAAPCFKWLEYGIAFDPNTQSGGSGVDAALAMEGVAYTNTVVLPGRPSTSRWSPQYHTLLGLSTNAAATTADFEFGGRVESAGELFGATNGATVVLYGVWRADPIPVALDRGDGAVAGDTNIYAVCGQSMPPAVMPSRPGGQFKGYWHEEAVGGPVQYYGPQGESVRDWDMEYAATLKARWSPVAASVSFEDGDGAEGGSGSIEVLYGALPPDIKVPVRKGWIFDGYWSFSVGGTRYYDESGKPTTEAWTRITPLKLYARWKPVEYTIVYIWDGGTPGGYVQNSAVSGMPFPVSVPVRDGYAFAGFELSGEYDPAAAGYGDTPNKAVAQSVKDGFCPAATEQRFMYFVNLASEATTVTLRARWEKTGDAASVATAMPKSMPRRAAASAGDGESGDAGVPPSAEELEQAADCAGALQLVPWMIEDKTQKQKNGCWMVGSDAGATNGTAVFCSITNVAERHPIDEKLFGRGIARLGATVTGKGELKFRWKATVPMPDVPESGSSILGAFVVVTQSFSKTSFSTDFYPKEQRPGTDWEEVVISIDTQNLDVVWFANTYSETYDLWIDDIRWVPRSIVAEAESVDLPYDGEGHSASVEVTYPTNRCEVTYALAESGPYSGKKPVFTNAVSTTVWYVVSAEGFPSYTNSVDVKITQATNEWKVVPDVEDRTAGDTNGVNFGEALFGEVKVEFWSGDGEIKYPDVANVSTGRCMAIFTVAETANWTGLSHTNIFETTPSDKRNITVAATPYLGEYDGSGHTIAISDVKAADGLPLAETNIAYSLSQDRPFDLKVAPLFTNVCETSVWYRVSAEGYEPLIGSVSVKITQAENSWTVEPSFSGNWLQDGTNCLNGVAKFGMATIEYFNSVDMLVSPDFIAGAGSYTARFTVAETENWTGLTKEVSFNVYGVGASATGYAGAYDGSGHGVAVSVSNPESGWTIGYALSPDAEYKAECPLFTNACETSVWYRVSAEGYEPLTGSASVKITQAENSWTVEPSFSGNWLQDGTNCLKGAAKFGAATIEYFNSVDMPVSPDVIVGAGSYTARFTVAETENWTGLTKDVSFNVYGASASATGYAGAYDGSGHGIAVSVSNPESGWTIGYALSPDAEYKAECPLFTNVCETFVWYRVSAEGYEPLTGSASVKITQAENSWTVEPSFSGNWLQDGTNCLKGAAKFGAATIEYFNSEDMPVSPDAITGAGSYTARFTVAETENWTGLTKDVSFNVYGASASATGYAGAYDGSGHGIAVSVSNPESGWTIGYALSPDAEYKAECPLFTNVCETSVWYRVSAAGYVSLTGCASVKIACATNTWKVAPSMASWRDTEDASEPESASAFGEVIVAYKTANGRVLLSRPSVRGDYVAVFTVEGSENWTSVSTEVPFTIYESEPVVCVMATSCMGEYDGSSHSIEVSVDPGATNRCSARYSLTKDGPFADAAPVYVQAMTNGPVKVWYEVLADGYAGVTNFATVEIFKATNAWLVVPNMAGRTAGVEYEPPAAVPQFGNVSVVYDGAATNAPRNAGIHTARFTVPETRNWCGLVTNISYRIAGDGSSGEEDDGGDSGGDGGGDSGGDSGGDDDGGGEGEGGGSGGGDGEESDAYAIAFTNDATYAKAQTIAGALYNADGSLAGVVQLKFGKKNARKSTVRVSGSATLLDGRKASARGVTLKFGEDGAVSGTLTFKEPVGEMALAAGADGVGLLAGASYFMKAAKVGGPLAGGAASGVFRLSDDFDLAAAGTLQTALLPFEEPFSVVRRKWKFPGNASVKLQTDKATGLKSLTVSYGRNGDKTNKSSIKLSYTEKTGRFTGSFKAYSVSENARGSKKLVKYTVKIVGFVLDGSGVGAATVKKPAGGPWAVSVE